MKLYFLLVALLALSCSVREQALVERTEDATPAFVEPDEVGNGGDFIRILMEEGRFFGGNLLRRIRKDSFPSNIHEYLKEGEADWLKQNKDKIENDLAKSKLVYVKDLPAGCPKDECGCAFKGQSKIYISAMGCEASLRTRQDAAKLLIHEVMHHFVGSNEAKAKRLGVALYSAWYNLGHPDTPHWKIFTCPDYCQGNQTVWNGKDLMLWDQWRMGLYDPSNDSWRFDSDLPQEKALAGSRLPKTASIHPIFIDGKVILFPDENLLGWSFDPLAKTWAPLSPPPFAGHYAEHVVSDGKRIYVVNVSTEEREVAGGIYDPRKNKWSEISAKGAPATRANATAIWANDRLVVYGGEEFPGGSWLSSGEIYHPKFNSWTPMSTEGAPSLRRDHRVVWTGEEMIVYGGFLDGALGALSVYQTTGAAFNPKTNRWRPIQPHPVAHVPVHGYKAGYKAAFWTGTHALFFGPSRIDYYNPARDEWLVFPNAIHYPDFLSEHHHHPTWTGMELIFWDEMSRTGYLFYP